MSAHVARAFAPSSIGNVAVGFDILGHSFAGPGDNLILIPFTVGERLFQRKGLNSIYLSAASPEQVNEAEQIVRNFMDKLTADKSASTTYNIYKQ